MTCGDRWAGRSEVDRFVRNEEAEGSNPSPSTLIIFQRIKVKSALTVKCVIL